MWSNAAVLQTVVAIALPVIGMIVGGLLGRQKNRTVLGAALGVLGFIGWGILAFVPPGAGAASGEAAAADEDRRRIAERPARPPAPRRGYARRR